MLNHPQFDPIAFSLFGLPVRWYGLMYVLGFAAAIFLGRRHLRRGGAGGMTAPALDEVIFFAILGVFIGGRLGYVLFYQFDDYIGRPFAAAIAAAFKDDGGGVWTALADSFAVLKVWEGGMSFHGGLIGVLIGFWWAARRRGWSFLRITDFAAPLAAPGLGFGRIGNFINGELWGRPTDLPWGMAFAPGAAPRHPSQLYEFALEGVALFALLWAVSAKPRPVGWISGVFLTGYAAARFTAEFAREPDAHLGLLFGGMSMGQLLCLPMAAVGVFLLFRHRLTESAAEPAPMARPKPPRQTPTSQRPATARIKPPARPKPSDEQVVYAAGASSPKPADRPKKRRKRRRPY